MEEGAGLKGNPAKSDDMTCLGARVADTEAQREGGSWRSEGEHLNAHIPDCTGIWVNRPTTDGGDFMKLATCAYSYRDLLKDGKMTLEAFMDLAAELNFDGIEWTAYYFPETTNAEHRSADSSKKL